MTKKPFPELRQKAAENIIENRRGEKTKAYYYHKERGYSAYKEMLFGFSEFFNYVIEHPTLPKRVLEVGVGEAYAFQDMRKEYKGKLELIGTALRTPQKEDFRENVHLTSAEALTGFAPESLGGVYGVYSLPYGQPELVTQRLHEVLAPGGIIKALFPNWKRKDSESVFHTSEPFVEIWKKLNYDIAILSTSGDFPENIVVAIKPGRKIGLSALDLLKKDYENYKKEDQ